MGEKFYLRQVRLDRGGYDEFGRYWGVGETLYEFESEDGDIAGHVRARTRKAAKSQIQKRHKGARFFR